MTIYAFSIENFKRSKYEVDALMDMAKIKLTQLAQHGELLDRYGARIRILGQRGLMQPDVLEAMDRACDMTSHNDKTVLNVCFPYTSRDEITTAVRRTVTDYSRPVEHHPTETSRKSPFTEERIANTIKSQHKSDRVSEAPMKHVDPEILASPSTSSEEQPQSDAASTSDYNTKQRQSRQPEIDPEVEPDADTSSVSSSSTNPHHEVLSPSAASSPPTSYMGSPQSKPISKRTTSAKGVTFQTPSYLSPESINSSTINSNLFTANDPPLDLLIRTSGVERLSDFMLWQCHQDTRIVFLNVLWPEFDLWHFLPVLWEWQWRERKEERLVLEGVKVD